ncbi:MAG TPA: hypothetical protein PLP75_12555 [Burkholderiales bacterium]|nr:hypothetical protein [Burkholderiales bacterium]
MNLFNKIKKANFIVCALAAVSYMNSASAVSFEARDWENPDVIGISLLNQTHSVRSYDFTKFFQALAIGQQFPLNVKGLINPSETIHIEYKVSGQSKTAFCGYWSDNNYAYPEGCLTYKDPYTADLFLFQTDDTSRYGVSPIIDGIDLPLQLSPWDLTPKGFEYWNQNYNILNNNNWKVIEDTSHVNSAKRQDGLSLTISSSSGEDYYLDKSKMNWTMKSDRSTPKDLPKGDYFKYCSNITYQNGVLNAECLHDKFNSDSDRISRSILIGQNQECQPDSIILVRAWGDNNGQGAGTLYCRNDLDKSLPDGDYFSVCKNISFKNGVISGSCKHDPDNQNSDDWPTKLDYSANCISGSLVSVRKWRDNNGNGAGTLYCLAPKLEGAGASKASAPISKAAILPWSSNSNSSSVLQKLKVFSNKWLHN